MDKNLLKITTILCSIGIFLGGSALAKSTYTEGPNEGNVVKEEGTTTVAKADGTTKTFESVARPGNGGGVRPPSSPCGTARPCKKPHLSVGE